MSFLYGGRKNIRYLEENMEVLNVDLTMEENAQKREAGEGAEVHGTRVAAALMGGFVMDTPALPTGREA